MDNAGLPLTSLVDLFVSPENRTLFSLILVLVPASYLPLVALTFHRGQRQQREREVMRILEKLNVEQGLRDVYLQAAQSRSLFLGVAFATLIATLGLTLLFLGIKLRLAEQPSFVLGGVFVSNLFEIPAGEREAALLRLFAYQNRALLVFSVAFLGAYLWGLQYLARRYAMNDLNPAAFYNLSIRMIVSAVIALLVYHAANIVSGQTLTQPAQGAGQAVEELGMPLLPALAFFIGMFPQRGIKWLNDRMSFLGWQNAGGAKPLPLELIEGVDEYDVTRFNEAGVDSCHDLAAADLVPLLLRTPYHARELIDWILQAKLCVRVGYDIAALRSFGYRTIDDLVPLDEATLEELAKESTLSLTTLHQAVKAARHDEELRRLIHAGRALGRYTQSPSPVDEVATGGG